MSQKLHSVSIRNILTEAFLSKQEMCCLGTTGVTKDDDRAASVQQPSFTDKMPLKNITPRATLKGANVKYQIIPQVEVAQ